MAFEPNFEVFKIGGKGVALRAGVYRPRGRARVIVAERRTANPTSRSSSTWRPRWLLSDYGDALESLLDLSARG